MEINNRIDKIAKQAFDKSSMESVNSGFTESIMAKISEANIANYLTITPIINKRTWFIISFSILIIIILSLAFIPANNNLIIPNVFTDTNFSNIIIPNINYHFIKINLNSATFYSIISFGIFFIIQILLINKMQQHTEA
ncbi:MAG: hypothetical protein KAG84_06605 [Bacteroidales bacterium]|nr:hypothetical protein [Bacteroidales bacterium]